VVQYKIQTSKPEHVVFGNGESRKNWTLKPLANATTWGCNAMYRDFAPDNLIAIDVGIQNEIVASGYTRRHQCWFAEWEPIPTDAFAIESIIASTGFAESQICCAGDPDSNKVVINGVDTSDERVQELKLMFPHLDAEDLEAKLKSDYGMYVTYVSPEDKIRPISDPEGWSAGTTAMHLACQDGAEVVYMIGFDLSSYSSRINNIYKGTPHYLPPEAKGFNPINWKNQLYLLFKEFEDVQFKWAYDSNFLKQNDFESAKGLIELPNVETIAHENIRLT